MLPRLYRLNRLEIGPILRRGRTWRGEGLTLRVERLAEPAKPTRFAIVVSAKTVKTAVGRNLLKRRLRHLVGSVAKNLQLGYGVVIVASPTAAVQSFSELKNNLQSSLKLSGLISA